MTQTLMTPEKQLNVRPSLLVRHPLASYFTLAYAIAWLLWLPLILSKGGGIGLLPLTTDATVDGTITFSLIMLGAFGPAIAAVIMTAIMEGRAGVGLLFRRIVRVRVGLQWYLVALFLPLLAYLFLLLLGILSAPDQYSRVFSSQGGFALFVYVVSALIGMVLGSPLGEEPGWRGFALPRLQQQMGPFKGTLLLGTLWGLWHAPLAFFTVWGQYYQLMGVVPGFLLFILSTISGAIVMTWLFNQTRGSIFLAILFHSAVNSIVVIGQVLFPESAGNLHAMSGPILLSGFASYVTVWAVIAAIVLVTTKGSLSYKPSQVRNTHDVMPRCMQDGARVLATITDVQIRQDWKEGERWERSSWDGRLVRQKTWQTCYDVTAEWMHTQTKQRYLFRSKVWSDEVEKTPTPGQTVVFMVDLRHPERSTADVQSFS